MSFKIYKAIGYGGYFIKGFYLNTLCDQFEDGVNGEVNQLVIDNLKASTSRYDHVFLETEEMAKKCNVKYPQTFSECVKYAAFLDRDMVKENTPLETSLVPIIVMPPLYAKSWHRWDDSIDYYSALDIDDHYISLEKPINPYNYWMDAETGENIMNDYDHYSNSQCMNNMVPGIPFSVKLIAEKLGFDWKILRPMAATWWS